MPSAINSMFKIEGLRCVILEALDNILKCDDQIDSTSIKAACKDANKDVSQLAEKLMAKYFSH